MEIRSSQETLGRLVEQLNGRTKQLKKSRRAGINIDDNGLIERMVNSGNGAKIQALLDGNHADFPSQSEADLALCNHLAFWTGKVPEQMDRIFRRASLMREKWDEKHYGDGRTYGQRTIERAIAGTGDVYTAKATPHSSDVRPDSHGNRDVQAHTGPRGLTLIELQGQYSSEPEWLWQQHIPKGMPIIINGREGDGKSTPGAGKSQERLFPPTKRGVSSWLATEGAVADTVNKMVELGLNDPRFVVGQKADGSFKWDFFLQGDRKELGELLGVYDPVLLVCIDSIRGMSRLDDNDARNGQIITNVNSIVCEQIPCRSCLYRPHGEREKEQSAGSGSRYHRQNQ